MHKLIILLFLTFIGNLLGGGKMPEAAEMKAKKVVMIIAQQNFRDEEYEVPKSVLTAAGIKVITASTTLKEAVGKLGMKVMPDILVKDIKVDDYDAVVFVGGPGSSQYFGDLLAHKIAQESIKKNKVLAAICIAPATLANAGVLKGKKATSFPSVSEQLRNKGAIYTGKLVECDGNIITAIGPEASSQFGEAIKQTLK